MRPLVSIPLVFVFTALSATAQSTSVDPPKPGIMVELFTSEGCSSCPPADALLRKLDSQSVIPSAEIVVLGEHVDYWDGPGWHDRFSSHDYTDRQEEYARKFHTSGPYTPQMVVDGNREFVGNDGHLLQAALAQAASRPKAAVGISIESEDGDQLTIKVAAGALPAGVKRAELYVALADNADETEVGGGENSGRRLQHVAVARNLRRVAKLGPEGIEKELSIRLPKSEKTDDLRVIAFIQEPNYGAMLGSAVKVLRTVQATR
jgi:hypothetical protein